MPILVRNVRLGLDEPEEVLKEGAARRLRVPVSAIRMYSVVRRSLDACKKDDIHFSYQMELDLHESHMAQRARLKRLRTKNAVWLAPQPAEVPECGTHDLARRPVIIGFGPAGMFAALRLAQFGYKPIVFERGRDVRRRHRDVMQRFYRQGKFDPSSNLLFGEGGAGTYSDGKLYTRINDPLCRLVLEIFYQHGGDPDILVDARPHIGSDRLPTVCMRIRKKIEALGGEIRFECRIEDLRVSDERLDAVFVLNTGSQGGVGHRFQTGSTWLPVGPTILAVGHSARDTIRMLHRRGVRIDPKPFQIGIRIEHPQAMIDLWQYGAAAGHQRLAPAEYHLVAGKAAGARGDVFSFCMCPGGIILPTNESPGLVATNGASRARRDSRFGNSGLVITIDPTELGRQEEPNVALAGLAYLERWERLAFEAAGGAYRIPAQRASDFLRGRRSNGRLETSYPLGGAWTDISALIPESVAKALRRALPMLDNRYPGFAGDEGVITAPETRASAPIRIVRDPKTRQAVQTANLYPVGEGAGYAGGIVSAAVDGIKTAHAIIRYYAPPR